MRNLPKIFLRSVENVGPESNHYSTPDLHVHRTGTSIPFVILKISENARTALETSQGQVIPQLATNATAAKKHSKLSTYYFIAIFPSRQFHLFSDDYLFIPVNPSSLTNQNDRVYACF